MKYLLTILIGLIGMGSFLSVSAQDKFYFNQWWEECEEKYQVYYMEVENLKDATVLRTYYSKTRTPIRKALFRKASWGGFINTYQEPEDSTGWWSFWHPNGQLASEWDMDARPKRIMNCWSPEGERTVSEGNGSYKGYDVNGKLTSEGKLKMGMKEGEWRYYQENEGEVVLWKIARYDQNVHEGFYREYYRNGMPRKAGWIMEGQRAWQWKWWKLDGSLLDQHEYLRTDDREYREKDIDAPVRIINLDEYKKMVGYPPMAKEAEIEGNVFYRFRISKTGEVLEKVKVEAAHPILEKAVEKQFGVLKFSPGMVGGEPQEMWVNLPLRFRLLR